MKLKGKHWAVVFAGFFGIGISVLICHMLPVWNNDLALSDFSVRSVIIIGTACFCARNVATTCLFKFRIDDFVASMIFIYFFAVGGTIFAPVTSSRRVLLAMEHHDIVVSYLIGISFGTAFGLILSLDGLRSQSADKE